MPRFFTLLARIEAILAALIFLGMVALFAVNVFVHNLLPQHASRLFWIDEAVRLMMLYLVFLSCGLALQQGRQVGVYAWRDRIMRRTNLPLRQLIDLLGTAVCLYLSWLSFKTVLFVAESGQIMTSVGLPAYLIYLAPTIGFLLMALRFGASLVGLLDRYSPQIEEMGE